MNELHTAYGIRNILDRGANDLPTGVSERLASARERALARMPAHGVAAAATPRGRARTDSPSWLARLALAAAPVMLVVFGLWSITQWGGESEGVALADLNHAVILDEVPISAYADHGFGVFVKNTRE